VITKRMIVLSVFSLIIILLPASCQQAEPLDQVTLQLKWIHQAQFAGYYLAQENGYYAAENLEVTFVEGGAEIDPIEQVLTGKADVGIYAPEDLIIRRSQGQPLVALAVIYQLNPLVFVALSGSGIKTPADFMGRSASLAPDGIIQFNAILEYLGLDQDQIEFKPYAYDYTDFFSGEVDITEAYSTGGLLRMAQQGYNLSLIWPDDYGVHFYSDTLFSSEDYLKENQDILDRFLRATLRGWREAIENQQAGVDATLLYALEADPDLQRQMLESSLPLVYTGSDPIGWIDPNTWQQMQDTLVHQGLLDDTVQISEMLATQFLEKIYSDTE
jgi:NitT/TauT family transport system substrate-binding protein